VAPQPPRRPGPVANESPASSLLHDLIAELLSAKSAWEQLGVRVAKGYTTAYGFHVRTLTEMKKSDTEASSDALMFVFSAVCVGLAGGVVGGVMGPWIKKTAESTAHFIYKEAVRSILQQGAKDLAKAGDERLKKLRIDEGSNDPYETKSPKEIAVDQDIRDRIASAFGPVLEALDAMIDEANKVQADAATGQEVLNSFRLTCPLMTDKPAQDDIPPESVVARAAELAMWVAWANERDWEWWTPIYQRLDAATKKIGTDQREKGGSSGVVNEIAAAAKMDPVGQRMLVLGKLGEVRNSAANSFGPRKDVYHVTYTDLRRLRALPLDDDTLPFRRLSGLRFQWDKTNPLQRVAFLSNFKSLKPVYKSP
jgi:hypothetical protein